MARFRALRFLMVACGSLCCSTQAPAQCLAPEVFQCTADDGTVYTGTDRADVAHRGWLRNQQLAAYRFAYQKPAVAPKLETPSAPNSAVGSGLFGPTEPTALPRSAAPIAGQVRVYGWKPPAQAPHPSTRYRLKMPSFATGLPASIDLGLKDAPIYDQGQLGSCTGNGWAGAVEFYDKNQVLHATGNSAFENILIYFQIRPRPMPAPAYQPGSRLFIYWNERDLEGNTRSDDGAAVADGAKVVSTLGVPPESDWPYQISRFATKPPQKAYDDAKKHVLPVPSSIDTTDLTEVKTCLAAGHPIVFGFTVYSSFESVGTDGIYHPSGRGIGGHCVVAIGYDDASQLVKCRNSWGTSWGSDGYFYFPYRSFASSQTSDAWTLAN